MRFLTKLLFAVALSLAVSPALADEHGHKDEHGHDEDHHVSEMNGLRAVHAWTRETKSGPVLVFAEIENESDKEIMLLGGHSEDAGEGELVGFQLVNGEATYVAIDQMPIKPGTEVHLEPEALAIRFDNMPYPLIEDMEWEIELEFDTGHLDVHVEVGSANARQHSHAGHQH